MRINKKAFGANEVMIGLVLLLVMALVIMGFQSNAYANIMKNIRNTEKKLPAPLECVADYNDVPGAQIDKEGYYIGTIMVKDGKEINCDEYYKPKRNIGYEKGEQAIS